MSSGLISALYAPSIGGVPFLFQSCRQSGGRKIVLKTFPDSNNRVADDLGAKMRRFEFTGVISSTTTQYFTDREKLENILNYTEGTILIVHPTLGQLTVVCPEYSIFESTDTLSTAQFTITFEEVSTPVGDTGTTNVVESLTDYLNAIESGLDTYINDLNNDLSSVWTVSYQYLQNFTYSKNLIDSFITNLESIPNMVSSLTENYATFVNDLFSYNLNEGSNIFDSTALATATATLFDDVGNITDVDTERSEIMESFFSYSEDTAITITTIPLDEREHNRAIFEQYINAMAFFYDCMFACTITYSTHADILLKKSTLNTQYKYILNNNDYMDIYNAQSILLSTDTLSNLATVRDYAYNYLTTQDAGLSNLISVTVYNMPFINIIYNYYGNLDYYDTLYAINDIGNPLSVTGSIQLIKSSS